MRTMRTAVAIMTIAATLALGTSAASADVSLSAAETGRDHRLPVVPDLHWVDCDDGLQCATATVPLDYDRPGGRHISLALARVPAGDPAHRIGSVFVNDGGPGNSVLTFVRDDATERAARRRPGPASTSSGSIPVVSARAHRCAASPTPERQQEFFGSLPPFPVTGDEIEQAADGGEGPRAALPPAQRRAPRSPLHGERGPRHGPPAPGRRR